MTRQHHTPRRLGPFGYRRDRDGCDDTWDIYDARDSETITSIPFWDCEPVWMERAEATARLFAASPELLRALKGLLEAGPYGNVDRYNAAVERALAAVAKATGRK